MEKYKRILDSVHGYIMIPELYCDSILDTTYFQRLRRIEQTSARTLFPSAHHDRFIHSLGVFHLGSRLCMCLRGKNEGNKYEYPDDAESVYESFCLACLLHDVGHSPFSHTFEDYYNDGNENLKNALLAVIDDGEFAEDWKTYIKDSKPHEIMSAYVALRVYREFIKGRGANPDLIARMIVGCRYPDKKNEGFKNAFIELLHSDVLDVDGLDYVCRDVWASGYSTFSIDVDRLLDAIFVVKNPDEGGKFTVCYSTKAINEIISVLGVKSFQSAYVFCHHIVVYEQTLLVKAMESTAMYVQDLDHADYNSKERTNALRNLCNYKSMLEQISLKSSHGEYPLIHPSDDDFVRLMKLIPNDYYVQQWLSRTYDLIPLWKSVVEYKVCFNDLWEDEAFVSFLKSDKCRQFVVSQFGYEDHKVWLCDKIGPKDKVGKSSTVNLFINGTPKKFNDIFRDDNFQIAHSDADFVYYFVPKEGKTGSTNVDDVVKSIKKRFMEMRGETKYVRRNTKKQNRASVFFYIVVKIFWTVRNFVYEKRNSG